MDKLKKRKFKANILDIVATGSLLGFLGTLMWGLYSLSTLLGIMVTCLIVTVVCIAIATNS